MSKTSNISPFTHQPTIKTSDQGGKKCKECTYNVKLWRVRVIFVPLWLLQQPEAIPLEDEAFMEI